MPEMKSPQEQLDEVLSQPGLSPKKAKQAEDWARNETARRAGFGMQFVADSEDRMQARGKQIDDDLTAETQAANALYDRVRKHDLVDVAEGFKEAREIRRQIDALERAIEALESTDQTVAAVKADPAAYHDQFFSKWPALADRVPTIAEALHN